MTAAPRQHPSPNYGPRRDGLQPELIVIHYTAMTSADAALARLCDPQTDVSAHYLISGLGDVIQMVSEQARAWHAGAGEWRGMVDINSRSIGIELDNRGDHPFSEPQMTALTQLLTQIMERWQINPAGVIGHSDMAPGRKVDPGPRFDWQRLERMGLAQRRGCDAGPQNPNFPEFRKLAASYGYTADVCDTDVLAAVRLRFRPHAGGPLDARDYTPLGHSALWT